MSYNRITIVGNVGNDPEVRSTAGGTTVANLRVAVSEREKAPSGAWVDVTEWFSVTCFGKTAEAVRDHVAKGKQLLVEGKLRTRKWEDREGNARTSTEIVADRIVFLGGKREDGGSRREEGSRGGRRDEPDRGKPDDDLPF